MIRQDLVPSKPWPRGMWAVATRTRCYGLIKCLRTILFVILNVNAEVRLASFTFYKTDLGLVIADLRTMRMFLLANLLWLAVLASSSVALQPDGSVKDLQHTGSTKIKPQVFIISMVRCCVDSLTAVAHMSLVYRRRGGLVQHPGVQLACP